MVRYPITLLALVLLSASAPAQTLPSAADVLDAFPHSLASARGVVVIPAATQGRTRDGVLFLKGADGWGEPVPVAVGGEARGTDPSADLVLVIRTRRSLVRITEVDGRADAEVVGYAGKKFSQVSAEGVCLQRGQPFPIAPKVVQELRARLAVLTNPPAAETPKSSDGWVLPTPENREALIGGVAAVAAWLAAFHRRGTKGVA